jgi:hypothetical protein
MTVRQKQMLALVVVLAANIALLWFMVSIHQIMYWIALVGLMGGSLVTVKHNDEEWEGKAGYFFLGACAMGILLHLLGYF